MNVSNCMHTGTFFFSFLEVNKNRSSTSVSFLFDITRYITRWLTLLSASNYLTIKQGVCTYVCMCLSHLVQLWINKPPTLCAAADAGLQSYVVWVEVSRECANLTRKHTDNLYKQYKWPSTICITAVSDCVFKLHRPTYLPVMSN